VIDCGLWQVGDERGEMSSEKKNRERETGCEGAVDWKRDKKSTNSYSVSVLDFYLQLK